MSINQQIRRGIQDGRTRFNLFPCMDAENRLYVIGFMDGRTKIGHCHLPRTRIRQHWVASEGSISWAHLFGPSLPSSACARIERLACDMAAVRAQRVRRTESFYGLDREAAIRCVREALREAGV